MNKKLMSLVISGLLAVVAGLIITSRFYSEEPSAGNSY